MMTDLFFPSMKILKLYLREKPSLLLWKPNVYLIKRKKNKNNNAIKNNLINPKETKWFLNEFKVTAYIVFFKTDRLYSTLEKITTTESY